MKSRILIYIIPRTLTSKNCNFIDYSFDSIERNSKRYKAVYEEFKRLNAFSFEELQAMVDNEKHITEHNKKVFYNTDYDKRLMNVFSTVK